MKYIKELFYGFAFGIANIIPGVSGGTIALALGFYERLLRFINHINLQILWENRRNVKKYVIENDWPFVLRLGFGALLCIALLSSVMTFLLEKYFELTYGFFFGLILLSVGVPWMLIKRKGAREIIALLLGLTVTIGVSASVNPLDKKLAKSALYEERYEGEVVEKSSTPKRRFVYVGKYDTMEYGMIYVAGMLAVSAMVLPGVSGSLVLILLGQYLAVVTSISNLTSLMLDEFVFLGVFSLGMILGILMTARIIEYLLKKFHDPTMGFLTGLIIGSLYALWPFKKFETVDLFVKDGSLIEKLEGVKVYTNINHFPSGLALLGPVLGLIILGGFCMFFFLKHDPEPKG